MPATRVLDLSTNHSVLSSTVSEANVTDVTATLEDGGERWRTSDYVGIGRGIGKILHETIGQIIPPAIVSISVYPAFQNGATMHFFRAHVTGLEGGGGLNFITLLLML